MGKRDRYYVEWPLNVTAPALVDSGWVGGELREIPVIKRHTKNAQRDDDKTFSACRQEIIEYYRAQIAQARAAIAYARSERRVRVDERADELDAFFDAGREPWFASQDEPGST